MTKDQTQRLDHFGVAPELFQPMLAQEKLLADSGLEQNLIELVKPDSYTHLTLPTIYSV